MSFSLGLIGLGTMGANLARNAARNGATVVLFNRTQEKTDSFMHAYGAEGEFIATDSYESFVEALPSPRAILLMVKAGSAVDDVLLELVPHLQKGDILIDGGNSHYRDSERRENTLKKKGIQFVGMGVSGGEQGALLGPSMMPGGSKEAYDHLAPLLQSMAADDGDKGKCVAYMGSGGAGHFVKMVHNGIEYGVMQLLAESYHLLKEGAGLDAKSLADLYAKWSKTPELSSFLLDITAKIFLQNDPDTGAPLIDVIRDAAGQKGTGKWTTEAAFDLGIAIPSITAAVDARIISSAKDFRLAESVKSSPEHEEAKVPPTFIEDVRSALELSILNTYAQGFQLLVAASAQNQWNLPLSEIIRCWQGGCIIRAELLTWYRKAFSGEEKASAHLRARFSAEHQHAWRRIVAFGAIRALPLPAMSASLSYYDSYRSAWLPQNLIQAQRDAFGAHTYERLDKEGTFHTEWLA
jgi:6-phosphogluconate dehydrogenase